MESRPMRRISWWRRRVNSSLAMELPGHLVKRLIGRERCMPRRRELLEQQLHPDAHELDQLRVGALVGLLALLLIDAGAGDLGEIADDLTHVPRQAARIRDRARAEAIEEPLAPERQCRGARLE